ncbi:hypothetical protein NYA22BAC_01709 [Parasphingorhabdus sp. NYA22]
MVERDMTTLKEARQKGKLKEFIKEHEADHDGDEAAIAATLRSMVGKSKPVPKTSSRDGDGD